MATNKKKVFALSFLTVFLWASAFPLTKVAQEQFTSIPVSALFRSGNFSHYHWEIVPHQAAPEKAYPFVFCIRRSGLYGLYDHL